MAWTLSGTVLPAPDNKNLENSVQTVMHRTLTGEFKRDFVGSTKRVLKVSWDAIASVDYDAIVSHWVAQRDTGATKVLVVDELGISMNVLIQIGLVDFDIPRYYGHFPFSAIFIEV